MPKLVNIKKSVMAADEEHSAGEVIASIGFEMRSYRGGRCNI